jgi:Na+/H+ antiporter NhaD/arsenite permease-like protein
VEVPVRYFQSVIAIELAVAAALLWQVRFFESSATARKSIGPDPRLRLALALVLRATVFAAIGVTVGLAVSVLPILLRVLPPLVRDVATQDRTAIHTTP